jgi:hypothetical protein
MAVYLGNTYMGSAYLGNSPIVTAEMKKPLAAQFRNDPYSASLVLAMPYSQFTTLGMTNFYDNVAASIKGVGTNYVLTPTGSAGSVFYPSASIMISSSYDWSNDGYTTSAAMSGSQNAGSITTTALNFGTNPFVIETWIQFKGPNNIPPYNQFFFGENSGDYLLTDYSKLSINYRLFTGVGGASLDSSDWIYTTDIWYNIAFVKSVIGGNAVFSIYLNGVRIGTASPGSNPSITGVPSGFWSILGFVPSGISDAGPHLAQDFRLYLGTDKNYTGSLIPIPQSIVTVAS